MDKLKLIDTHTDWVDRKGVIETAENWSKRQHCKVLTEKGIPYHTACEMACYDPMDAIEDEARRYMAWFGWFVVVLLLVMLVF
jgi:hypothetical protein